MTKAPELKPCPWCGGANITKVDDGESEWLICANCEATGPYSPDAYAADLSIEQAWNTRVSPSPEAFQQMREALEWLEKHRLDAIARVDAINAPEDEEVLALCERVGYGAVMDAASRLWARKHLNGAFYIGGCIGDTSARAALKAAEERK